MCVLDYCVTYCDGHRVAERFRFADSIDVVRGAPRAIRSLMVFVYIKYANIVLVRLRGYSYLLSSHPNYVICEPDKRDTDIEALSLCITGAILIAAVVFAIIFI